MEWEEGNRRLEMYKPGFLKLQVKQGGGVGSGGTEETVCPS
jgi:hypothetical protein